MSKGNLRRFLNDPSCKLALHTGDLNYLNKKFTINGSPSLNNSPFGKSMYFIDDNNDRIAISPNLDYSEPFTIVAWINPTDLENNFNTLSHSGADGNRTFNFRVINSSGSEDDEANKLQFWVSEDGSAINRVHSNANVPVGEWSMVVGVFDGDKTYVYLNDTKSTDEYELSGSSLYDSTSQAYVMGYDGGSPTSVGEGMIDNILIFNRVLSEQEISDLYNASTFNYMDSLVGYWKLDDENTVKDLSGNGNDGTVEGNPVLENSIFGKSLVFDGSGDYVDCNSIDIVNKLSASVWIKSTNVGDIVGIIDQSFGSAGFSIDKLDSDLRGFIYTDDGVESVSITFSNVSDGLWHHVLFTYDGSYAKLFVDGIEKDRVSLTGDMIASETGFRIGNRVGESTNEWNGSIDKVMIFNKALTETQIKDIYNKQKGGRL